MSIDKTITPLRVRATERGRESDLGVTVASTARDSGNTPTTTLRKGLVMGKITASKKYAEYDDAETDGTEVAVGILADSVDLTDQSSDGCTPTDQDGALIMIGDLVEDDLIGLDAAAKVDLGDRITYR